MVYPLSLGIAGSAALAIGRDSRAPFALNQERRVADSMADFPPVPERRKAKHELLRLSADAGRSCGGKIEGTLTLADLVTASMKFAEDRALPSESSD